MFINQSIKQFEISITMRVLCGKLPGIQNHVTPETFKREELLSQAVYAANSILRENGIINDIKVRMRGKKAFIIHEQTHRILAELAISAESSKDGLRRPLFILLDRRGFVRSRTVGELLKSSTQSQRCTNRIAYINKVKDFMVKGEKR